MTKQGIAKNYTLRDWPNNERRTYPISTALQVWANNGDDLPLRSERRSAGFSVLPAQPSITSPWWDGTTARARAGRNQFATFALHCESAVGAPSVTVAVSSFTSGGNTIANTRSAAGNGVFDFTGMPITIEVVGYAQYRGMQDGFTGQNFEAYYDERHLPPRLRRPLNANAPGGAPGTAAPNGTGVWTDRPIANRFVPMWLVRQETYREKYPAGVDIPANSTQTFWIDVYVPPGQATGVYTATATISIGGTAVRSVPLELTVQSYTLSDTPGFFHWSWLSRDELQYRMLHSPISAVATGTTTRITFDNSAWQPSNGDLVELYGLHSSVNVTVQLQNVSGNQADIRAFDSNGANPANVNSSAWPAYTGGGGFTARRLTETTAITTRFNTITDNYAKLMRRHRLHVYGGEPDQVSRPAAPSAREQARLTGTFYGAGNGYAGPGAGVGDRVYPLGLFSLQQNATWGLGVDANLWALQDDFVGWFSANAPSADLFAYVRDEAGGTRVTVDATANTLTGITLANNTQIMVFARTVPPGLSETTVYFVVNASGSTFQVSTTSGGAPVDITGLGDLVYVSTALQEVRAFIARMKANPGAGVALRTMITGNAGAMMYDAMPQLDGFIMFAGFGFTTDTNNARTAFAARGAQWTIYNGKSPSIPTLDPAEYGSAQVAQGWVNTKASVANKWHYLFATNYYFDYQNGNRFLPADYGIVHKNLWQDTLQYGRNDGSSTWAGVTGFQYTNGGVHALILPGNDRRYPAYDWNLDGGVPTLSLKYIRKAGEDAALILQARAVNATATNAQVNARARTVLHEVQPTEPQDPSYVYADRDFDENPVLYETSRDVLRGILGA
jgi:hypothetical protein